MHSSPLREEKSFLKELFFIYGRFRKLQEKAETSYILTTEEVEVLIKKDPTIEAQGNWMIMDYRQYAAWRETDEGKDREIVFGKFEACSDDDSIIFMECNEKVSKELKKDCHRKQYIRSRDAETPFQVMSYSTMTFQESEIYGEDVLKDTECNVEESVMQRMDIERVRTALKMLTPEERAIIQNFLFTESPVSVKELVEKYAMPKTSIYRKRDDALKKLKKILGNA